MIDVLGRLKSVLKDFESLAVAVSGGVDSMTLARVTHQVLGGRCLIVHAVSDAVPQEATLRVQQFAERYQWPIQLVDAGEFGDTDYLGNPVNRCYYCKSCLYRQIRSIWEGPIASGANLDDLGDYRPGLIAAAENGVIHPLIDAQIDKAGVRSIAQLLNMKELAELPAQPCLSSRIETGIAVDPLDLIFIYRIEKLVRHALGAADIRCRVTQAGVRIELGRIKQFNTVEQWSDWQADWQRAVEAGGRRWLGVAEYRRGSAFIHEGDGNA